MNRIRKHRIWVILVAFLVLAAGALFFLGGDKPESAENMLLNGDFSLPNDENLPLNWYTSAYFPEGDTGTVYALTDIGAYISSQSLNDARFAQGIVVEPDTLYCISGQIRANASEGLGANLSVEGVYAFSDSVYNTNGEWQDVSLYGRTGKDQSYLTVFARLGGYGGESAGEAWFRNITLRAVSEVPSGYWEQAFAPPAPVYSQSDSSEEKTKTGETMITIVSVVYLAVFFFLLFNDRLSSVPSPLLKKNTALSLLAVAGVLVLALASRVAAALLVPGYDVDIGCFTAWAQHMAQTGPVEFYKTVGFCDYPPGYMNILWLIGLLGRLLQRMSLFANQMEAVMEFLVKTPAILSDCVLCLILYQQGKKQWGHRNALLLSLCWALNPVSFAAGACWGQTDGLMTLLLVIAVLELSKNRWKVALPVYVAAVLIKPQALMFGPMGVAALALQMKEQYRSKRFWKDLAIGVGFSVLVFALLALPFILHGNGTLSGLPFLFDLYGNTMNSYGYVTINACNPYFLMGLNWVDSASPATLPVLLGVMLLAMLPACLTLFFTRDRHPKGKFIFLLVTALSGAFAAALVILQLCGMLSWALMSTCLIVYIVLLICGLFFLRNDIRQLPVYAAVLLMLLFACCGMMHERYLFPVVVLLFLGYITTRDKRILYLAAFVTIASFINIACVLDRNIRIGGSAAHLHAPAFAIESDLKLLECLSAVMVTVAAAASVCVALSPATEKENNSSFITLPCAPRPALSIMPPPRLCRLDVLLMAGVTLLYSVLAFTNLGSTKAPQTAWVAQNMQTDETGGVTFREESILLDLSEIKDFSVLYFSGIHQNDASFTVEVSHDQGYWDMRKGNVTIGDCFKWKYVTGTEHSPLSGRYVRITADSHLLTLYEILLKDAVTGEILPYEITEATDNTTARFIADEQDTLERGEPSWFNSTYFDEIYHARTGFEHLHGLPTYETTHPPLGKVLISWAISVFGMTPFGWRFAGALAGVLMLPAMYLLGRMLIKNKWGGLFAMLMMTFDLMHFTQTRIATIDSFVVLFILWSVYFMLYWFKMDYFGKPFWKTLVPLGLSGLFMGLSIASKWTGCYNGVNLAILFFWGLYRCFCQWKDACETAKVQAAERAEIAKKRRTLIKKKADVSTLPDVSASPTREEKIAGQGYTLLVTVASCFVFFIFIPLLIYYLSYIPYFRYNGGVTVKKVIETAVGTYFQDGRIGGMLGYHKQPGLGMDHYFYSPWYEWPFIVTPMWYYSSASNTPQASQTLLAMGNPAVWWTGLVGLMGVAVLFVRRHIIRSSLPGPNGTTITRSAFSWHTLKDDPRFALLIFCFLAQYLPWALVPRGTYIYHYFPSVPFIILSIGLCLDAAAERRKKIALVSGAFILILALILFIAFFPYASGVSVPQRWLDWMKWFPNWLYY